MKAECVAVGIGNLVAIRIGVEFAKRSFWGAARLTPEINSRGSLLVGTRGSLLLSANAQRVIRF